MYYTTIGVSLWIYSIWLQRKKNKSNIFQQSRSWPLQNPPPATSMKIPRIKLVQKADTRTISFKSCIIFVDYLITKCATFDDARVVEDRFFFRSTILGKLRLRRTPKNRNISLSFRWHYNRINDQSYHICYSHSNWQHWQK